MTTWRWGVQLDERTADMLDEAQALAGLRITCTQGSYSGGVSASAGTHDGGGAVDISASGLNRAEADALVLALRQVGFAAWLRNPDQGNWPYHIHAIAGGCPDLSSGARDQWNEYLAGGDALAGSNPDDGPRDFDHVGILWEEYRDRHQEPTEEEDDVKPYAVHEGDGWVLTDLATWRKGIGNYAIIDNGLAMGVYQGFNAGQPVSPVWVDFLRSLPEVA